MPERYLIKLNHIHKEVEERTGLTAYRVAKDLGLNESTTRKYLSEEIVAEFLPAYFIKLAGYYGYDWRDPEVIEVIQVDEDSEEIITPETALAS